MVEAFLREATPADAEAIWLWRNDPQTVAASFNRSEVGWEDHVRWYGEVIDDPVRDLLVLQSGDDAVGMIRVDPIDEGAAEISINMSPAYRGRGLGARALVLALEWLSKKDPPRTIFARVRADNAVSLRTFAAAGFVEVDREAGVVKFVAKMADP